jgi:hypothetical protein
MTRTTTEGIAGYVGQVRSDGHGTSATGVVDTSTGNDNTVVTSEQLEDVVRRKPTTTIATSTTQEKSCGQELVRNRKLVLMRSFSQNNPINRKVCF